MPDAIQVKNGHFMACDEERGLLYVTTGSTAKCLSFPECGLLHIFGKIR